jgi:dihydrolipoyl dehydrogenase
VTGEWPFLDPDHIEVSLTDGAGRMVIRFDKVIIAAGSEAVQLPFVPQDPRIVDSTGALGQAVPEPSG